MTHHDIVLEACVRANPEIKQIDCGSPCHCKILKYRDVRLADVLLAIVSRQPSNKTLITLESDGQFVEHWFNYAGKQSKLGPIWNLRNDSLEWHRDNKPETVAWLAKLLTNN